MKSKKTNGEHFAIKVEDDIPLPPERGIGITAAIRRMSVGASFVLPAGASISNVWPVSKRLGMKLTSRKQSDGSVRVWRVA